MTAHERKVYNEGFKSGDFDANPYPDGCIDYCLWFEGAYDYQMLHAYDRSLQFGGFRDSDEPSQP